MLEKILAILNYYTCGNNLFKSIASLGRKNLTDIEPIIKHLEEVQKAGITIGDEDLSQQVSNGLYKIPLNNSKGTLATVIQFLTQQMQVTQANENRYEIRF